MQNGFGKIDPQLLVRAREIASEYRAVIERDGEGGFVANSLEMPSVYSQGKTAEACFKLLMEALTQAVAMRLQNGKVPPRSGKLMLTEQLNLRITTEEKVLVEAAASRLGFRGVSEYIRHVLLKRA